MEQIASIILNYGGMGAMLYWFMFKQSKDNEQTRELLTNLTILIEKIGGVEKGAEKNE
ncbi:hypothetical protein [Bacillus velezensis]|uniref:hypothetical protein n=1 Tax=Bacillus velezensis TaxID=492670 RepID=UPI003EC119B8